MDDIERRFEERLRGKRQLEVCTKQSSEEEYLRIRIYGKPWICPPHCPPDCPMLAKGLCPEDD